LQLFIWGSSVREVQNILKDKNPAGNLLRQVEIKTIADKKAIMARIFAGGREIDVPTDAEGNVDVEQLRDALNVPRRRTLIRQRTSGENTVVPRRGRIKISPYEHFLEAPIAIRGQ